MNDITTTIPTIEREDLVILRLTTPDLHSTRAAAEAFEGDFVGFLQQNGLGSPSYFAGTLIDGKAPNRAVLAYDVDGQPTERIWNYSRETNGSIAYKFRNDNSSHGYTTVAE
ncbi:MAG: hypothetical protein JWQ64_2860 [Subtercola sp.]|jgi:hypothetical protein|nr:hypothetical protein [Subtercola sp.]